MILRNVARAAALASPDVIVNRSGIAMDRIASAPDDFAKRVASDYARSGPIVTASGLKPE